MSKIVPLLDAISERVKLFDLAGEFIRWIEPEAARGYLQRGEVIALHTKRKVRGVKLIADYSGCGPEAPARKTGMGLVHTRENYYNPKGVYTFDRLPRNSRELFTRVIDDCLKKAA